MEENNTIKVEPIIEDNNTADDEEMNKFSDIFKQFADALGGSAKQTFGGFSEYIKSPKFKSDLNEKSQKYDIPPKQLAKSFFLKIFGILGDIVGIAINTACNLADTAVNILASILHGGIELINKAVNAVGRIFTLNQTATA